MHLGVLHARQLHYLHTWAERCSFLLGKMCRGEAVVRAHGPFFVVCVVLMIRPVNVMIGSYILVPSLGGFLVLFCFAVVFH